jgi:hypothetical protein
MRDERDGSSLDGNVTKVVRFAELHCLSNHSFLRGTSHLEELVERAAGLGYAALAITDECSVAGVVKALKEAKRRGLKLIVGSGFRLRSACRHRAGSAAAGWSCSPPAGRLRPVLRAHHGGTEGCPPREKGFGLPAAKTSCA